MFTLIPGLPDYAVGVVARGRITEGDYKKVLTPALKNIAAEWRGINFLLVMETGLENFSAAAWLQDIKINLAYFLKWNKLAVVTHGAVMEKVTRAFGLIAPGEVRSFAPERLDEAKAWISAP